MRTKSLLGLGLLLLPVTIACGDVSEGGWDDGTEEALGRHASAVQGGTQSTKKSHNFAVGIASRYGAVCTGTLIAPNLVLTARHCVVPPDGGDAAVTCADRFPERNVNPSTLFVTTEPRLMGAKTYYAAKKITTPKAREFCGNDIALLTLEKNIPAEEAEPATPVVQFSMTDRTKIGDRITALGYGITNPSASDSGIRRIREDIDILCVPGDDTYKCDGIYARMLDSDSEFITEGFVCSGDSGGGAFEQESFNNGAPYVLGALSRGPQTNSRCLAAIYTRTDSHAEMILAEGKAAAEEGGYTVPQWVSPTAEEESEELDDSVECFGNACTVIDATEPEPPPTQIVTKTTTTGCAASPISASSQGALGAFSLVGLSALAFARRRRAV